MQSFKLFFEKANLGGPAYERTVHSALVAAKVKGLNPGGESTAGFSNIGHGDIEANYNGKPFCIEVKLNKDAQMGGTSINMNVESDVYVLSNPEAVDTQIQELFLDAARKKKNDVKRWVDFIRKQPPKDLHQKILYSIPFGSVTKEAWIAAEKEGLLKALNQKITFDNANQIATEYNRKDVYYIQIGGAGLFYLGKNPLKLPVPKYDGTVDIEFRLGPSGSKEREFEDEKIRVVSANYRCQGRLKTNIKSKYTLDDPDSIRELFSNLH